MPFQRIADFQGTFDWCFRAVGKDERHPVTGREPNQFTGRFGLTEMLGFPNQLIKLFKYLALIVNQEFRKAHHIHEQDMGDFEMKVLFVLSGHVGVRMKLREQIISIQLLISRNETWHCRTPRATTTKFLAKISHLHSEESEFASASNRTRQAGEDIHGRRPCPTVHDLPTLAEHFCTNSLLRNRHNVWRS